MKARGSWVAVLAWLGAGSLLVWVDLYSGFACSSRTATWWLYASTPFWVLVASAAAFAKRPAQARRTCVAVGVPPGVFVLASLPAMALCRSEPAVGPHVYLMTTAWAATFLLSLVCVWLVERDGARRGAFLSVGVGLPASLLAVGLVGVTWRDARDSLPLLHGPATWQESCDPMAGTLSQRLSVQMDREGFIAYARGLGLGSGKEVGGARVWRRATEYCYETATHVGDSGKVQVDCALDE